MTGKLPMATRFRGFLPVVIDVECGGFNPNTDALLEIAAVLIEIQGDGSVKPGESWRYHVQAFPGANFVPGFTEGVIGMKIGEVRKLVSPARLGYGDEDYGQIPGGSVLVFEVTLGAIS